MKKLFVWVFFIAMLAFLVYSGFYVLEKVRYPLKYKNYIMIHAETYNLQPELVASVINVESSFDKDAVSSSGAIGLMQVLPSTAEEVADKLNYSSFQVEDLLTEYKNIEIGCYYLRYLLDYFDENLYNALASYNAGLNNVNTWLGSSKYSEDGEHLTSTPYKETNEYIEKIYKNMEKYKAKF